MAHEKRNNRLILAVPSPRDVLMGRGALATNNEGNIRFRSLVKDYQYIYVSTSRRKKKTAIANNIRAQMKEQNRMFLRRVDTEPERRTLGLSSGVEAWVEADEASVMQKIKQALRETDGWGVAIDDIDFPLTSTRRPTQLPEGTTHVPFSKKFKEDRSVDAHENHLCVHEVATEAKPRMQKTIQAAVIEPSVKVPHFASTTSNSRPESHLRGHSDLEKLHFLPRGSFRGQCQHPNAETPCGAAKTEGPKPFVQNQQHPTAAESARLLFQLEQDRQATLRRLQQQDQELAALRQAIASNAAPLGGTGASVVNGFPPITGEQHSISTSVSSMEGTFRLADQVSNEEKRPRHDKLIGEGLSNATAPTAL